jgi:hypothetical protein
MKHILSINEWRTLNEDIESTEGSESTTAADITSAELKTAVTVVNGLISRGFTKNEAVSLAGNMSVESRFNTAATDGKAVGLCQWQGARLKALKAFAAAKEKAHTDLETQMDFVKHEMKDYYLPYVSGVPKDLVYINSGTSTVPKYTKTRKELTKTQAISRDFETATIAGKNVSDLTKELCNRVFKPTASLSHMDRRVANAIKIKTAVG